MFSVELVRNDYTRIDGMILSMKPFNYMENKPIRVLQCVNDMHRAGLETMLMNYYRHIDRSQIQFDFLTHRPKPADYDEEIEALGGRVYYAPRLYPHNYPSYFKWMKIFFSEHQEYKIIHSHIDSMSYLPLLAAKKAGLPIRIAHSHNTNIDKDIKYLLKQFFRIQLPTVANHYFACGVEAGNYLFGSRSFKVLPNAVDAPRFFYNERLRGPKRSELGYKDEFIIGHVGRISYQKNHKFLISIFNEILNIEPQARLMLIGVGEKEKEIRQMVNSLGLTSKVDFLGKRSDVHELYQAMDAFVLPSLFEGVPLVGIEAQFADLPCYFSDKTPKEVQFSDKASFLSLNLGPRTWAEEILVAKNKLRNSNREIIKASSYDISNAHHKLVDYYFDLLANLQER